MDMMCMFGMAEGWPICPTWFKRVRIMLLLGIMVARLLDLFTVLAAGVSLARACRHTRGASPDRD